jgi:hypothetical protein
MQPAELTTLITSPLAAAVDIVEMIDNRSLWRERNWDLRGWTYDFVPWGIRFLRQDSEGHVLAAVVAVALAEACRTRRNKSQAGSSRPTTILILG